MDTDDRLKYLLQPAFDAFDTAIIRARKAYEDYVAGGEAHAHIDSADMEKVWSETILYKFYSARKSAT